MFNQLYIKIAFNNLKKNPKLFLPFIISGVFTIMTTYIVMSLSVNPGLSEIPGGDNLQTILSLGSVLLIFFAVLFLLYINSFMIKTRKKEFGLYNVLGMDKKHIMHVLFYETTFLYLISMVLGIIAGILLNKVTILFIRYLMNAPVSFGSEFSFQSMIWTLIFFVAVFIFVFLGNIFQIHRSSPIELLKGGNMIEKEPKANSLVALLGVLVTIVGYYLCFKIISPITEIQKVFLAGLLIIVGTYFIFTSISIAVLKLMKNREKFYYQTNHFIPISGMLSRMKKNGVGLANICIMLFGTIMLLSMGLSMLSTPKDQIETQYPSDAFIELQVDEGENVEANEAQLKEEMHQASEEVASMVNVTLESVRSYAYLSIFAKPTEKGFGVKEGMYEGEKLTNLILIDKANYQDLTGEKIEMKEGEVLIYGVNEAYPKSEIEIMNTSYQAIPKDNMEKFSLGNEVTSLMNEVYYVIVNDLHSLTEIAASHNSVVGKNFARNMVIFSEINLAKDTTKEAELKYGESLQSYLESKNRNAIVDTKTAGSSELYALHSGVLFLVLNLGLLLLLATILTIYFKQISEAYDDRERFNSMKKIGLSRIEIKALIEKQTLSIFFLPLIVCGIHAVATFSLLKKFMFIILLNYVDVYLLSVIASFVVFSLLYFVIYKISAKSYYEIVNQ
ncbi:ABC transporter permease [Facklamia lactis]|uniref:ABC transporter permease n=1 Tax=Facklamia lactis TaxID=2749967 RepID=UPI0018CD9A10|nr:ABC transporter permease [Facklamia lactis]MBG9979541.1 ABC transporter permease [Facklamia lactis]